MSEQSGKKRLDLNATQVVAGSLAAVTSAVAASRLGLGGSLVGAGVGSVVATVGGAVYAHYIDRTRHQVRSVVLKRPAETGPTAGSNIADQPTVTMPLPPGSVAPDPASPSPPMPAATQPEGPADADQPTWAWLRSRRLALGATAAVVFGIALLTGNVFAGLGLNLFAADDPGVSVGRSLSNSSASEEVTPAPSPDATTDEQSTSAPTEEATPTPSVTEPPVTSEPTSQPTLEPTSQPTSQPQPTSTVPIG
jgi:hypothetical protein